MSDREDEEACHFVTKIVTEKRLTDEQMNKKTGRIHTSDLQDALDAQRENLRHRDKKSLQTFFAKHVDPHRLDIVQQNYAVPKRKYSWGWEGIDETRHDYKMQRAKDVKEAVEIYRMRNDQDFGQ